jgi:hypothetical protein
LLAAFLVDTFSPDVGFAAVQLMQNSWIMSDVPQLGVLWAA